MSKERARRRATREAERAAALAETERRRQKQARRQALRRHLPRMPARKTSRPARYGALPNSVKARLAVGWLAVQVLVGQLTDSWAQRVGIALLTLAVLPLVVVLTLNTASRRNT